MTEDPLKISTLSPGEIAFYRDYGFLVIPGLLSHQTSQAMRGEVLHILDQQGTTVDRLRQAMAPGDKLRQTGDYLVGTLLERFINSDGLRQIAGQLIGADSWLYLPFTAVKNGGGGGQFHFHQDNQYTRFEDGLAGINMWTALEDMSPENGCLQIVPRSHLRGTLEARTSGDGDAHRRVTADPENFLPLRMHAGDCVAFSRLTVHGSGPNLTGEPRVAYAVQFAREGIQAVWDNQPLRPLNPHGRWRLEGLQTIQRSAPETRDGH